MNRIEAGTAWKGLVPAGCEQCEVVHLVQSSDVGGACPACAVGVLESMPGRLVADPEQVVPFSLAPDDVKPKLAKWAAETPLRSPELDAATLTKRLVPVWWPMWLVDADVEGHWSAEAGYDYEAKSSKERFRNGSWHTEHTIDVRIRWEERLGTISRRYENVSVVALQDHAGLTKKLGQTVTHAAQPFRDAHLDAAMVRLPDVDHGGAWPYAESQLRNEAAAEARAAIGSEHIRDFTLHAEHGEPNWTWLLQPMYATWYTDGAGKRHVVLINGQSGKVGGKRMASMSKALTWAMGLLALAIGGFLLLAVMALIGLLLPPLIAIAMVLALIPLFIGLGALWPPYRAWSWNRGQG